jgi:hypothetical protein
MISRQNDLGINLAILALLENRWAIHQRVQQMGKNLDLVNNWYPNFDKGDLDAVVSVYADDAILVVGAGDSEGAVPYGGRFVGISQIRHYYAWRFSLRTLKSGILRPFCGVYPKSGFQKEFGPWVIIGGDIEDTHGDRSPLYKGPYLHVWCFDGHHKVTSLNMYFDNDAAT